MAKNTKIKKLIHKINWYVLEHEEKKDLFDDYEKIFNEDFKKEISFLKKYKEEKSDTSAIEDGEIEKKLNSCDNPDLKNLYREIIKKTHPDFFGDKYEEIFKLVTEAFRNEDWTQIILIAGDLNIDIDEFSEDTISLIEKDIQRKKNDIASWRDSIAWEWSLVDGDEKEKYRKHIRNILNINEDEFKEFLNS